jgi:2,4-dienoyl-CoA reductase-like NADH-dependent reductase (Old Yellow Enzyme family)
MNIDFLPNPSHIAMPEPFRLTRIPSLKTTDAFRSHIAALGIELPCEDAIESGDDAIIASPVGSLTVGGKQIGNRIAIHPMEGWDGTRTGGVTGEMRRRWQRFGESGAKLICGCEAMAVRPDGRANPNQLIICEENKAGIGELMDILRKAHVAKYGSDDDLVIGFQLTHSGRFCRPNDNQVYEAQVAYRHPILDAKFKVESDEQIWTDDEIWELIQCYIRAAKIAKDLGADFVDIKHCHGYLLHEFLGAHTRPGEFGGSFENRTRILREIVAGIRSSGNDIDFAVRLSCFDKVPHRPDPELSRPGKLGPGIPEEHSEFLPYRFGFGVNQDDPTEIDLEEPLRFVDLCADLGVKILNTSAGSPYYTPHLQRPAAYPPSDGYQPAYDPLVDLERQVQAVRQIKEQIGDRMVVVGSGYSYLQEYLPHVSQYVLRNGWADMIGLGRVVLSYPDILADAAKNGELTKRQICRTFSDCTTAPRNGIISGCYPLDPYYASRLEAQEVKAAKKRMGS